MENLTESSPESDVEFSDDGEWVPSSEDSDDELCGWICANCTEVNDETPACQMCGVDRHDDAEQPPADYRAPTEATLPVVIAFDERMLLHTDPTPQPNASPHPERPARLQAILNRLAAAKLFPGRCKRLASRKATVEEMKTAHDEEHVRDIDQMPYRQFTRLDTYANEHTPLATRLAAAATVDVALALAKKEAAHGGAIVRPPGHHAERNGIMGFCMCNNAAVAVRAAQDAGAKRVLVVDWDVHHGNGTQNIFDRDPSVLYVSLHRFQHGRFYPGTGHPQEMGEGPGKGYSVNIAWNAGGVGDGDYITAFLQVVLPVAYEFAPDLTIVSAGFDAAAGDPLGGCSLTPAGYAHMTALLKPLAPVELLLEGGYNLRSISASAEACMHVLCGGEPLSMPVPPVPTAVGQAAIQVRGLRRCQRLTSLTALDRTACQPVPFAPTTACCGPSRLAMPMPVGPAAVSRATMQATIEAVGMCWESLSGVSALRVLSSSLPTQHAHPRENAALSVQGSAKEGSTDPDPLEETNHKKPAPGSSERWPSSGLLDPELQKPKAEALPATVNAGKRRSKPHTGAHCCP
ncbi:hypothetical protein CYMTET_45769 [Cymbomonas tetramitiformis]|uniref:histone deacetylase n=1 Tax=Cymbomonas tetramitiformis TaxID=36881 RepID=A0AAE0BXJ0_9CHLO|nr:hypothetical protein CYMTET_45769 [Cymbomonas tetramitiformis]